MEFYFLSSVSVLVSIQRTKQDEILEICPLGNLLAYCIAVVLDEACKANADARKSQQPLSMCTFASPCRESLVHALCDGLID